MWAQYEAERGKPAVTKLSRRGYVTGKVAPRREAAEGRRRSAEAPRAAPRPRRGTGRGEADEAAAEDAPAADAPAEEAPAEDAPAEDAADDDDDDDARMTDDDFDDDDDDDDFDDEIGAEGNRIVGARASAVVEHVTRNLADDPDAIDVDVERARDDEVALLVHASPGDMGRIIGKRGRVIQALRQVVRAAGSADGVKVNVDVAE